MRKSRFASAVAGLALNVLLLGCATQPAQPPNKPHGDWLGRLADAQEANATDRASRLAELRTRSAAAQSFETRLELAALLAGPGGNDADRSEARGLLGTCSPASSNAEERSLVAACRTLAALLDALAASSADIAAARAQQERLSGRVATLEAELAAATSAATTRYEQDARKLVQLERRIAEQQRQNRQLRRQIRALQDIESSIEDRHDDGTPP